jgi:hypothetical protein
VLGREIKANDPKAMAEAAEDERVREAALKEINKYSKAQKLNGYVMPFLFLDCS